MNKLITPLIVMVASTLASACDVGKDPRDQRTLLPGNEGRGLDLRPDLQTVQSRNATPWAIRVGRVAAPAAAQEPPPDQDQPDQVEQAEEQGAREGRVSANPSYEQAAGASRRRRLQGSLPDPM